MSTSRANAKKGKGIAQDQADDSSRATKKQRRQSQPQDTPSSKRPSTRELLAKLENMKIIQTRWADHELLRTLAIHDDVKKMFSNMGLEGLFNMSYVTHVEATKQFIATMTFFDDANLELNDENRGKMSFKIGKKKCTITMAQLGAIFNFPTNGEVQVLGVNRDEGERMWSLIASGTYEKGKSKASLIRHPAIRYVHKFLAHTLYERRENGAVKEEEMALIIEGLKPLVVNHLNEREFMGLPRPVNLAFVLANRFLYYQDWIAKTENSQAQLGIGGLITPILISCGIALEEDQTVQPKLIDVNCLHSTHFLIGRIRNTYGYRFYVEKDEDRTIILPRATMTNIFSQENITFKPSRVTLHNPIRDGRLTTIKGSRSAPQYRSQMGNQEEQIEEEEEVMGFKRYEFDPYADPIKDKGVRVAHEHISMLKRLTKWQNKQIKKLVKTVKKQGKLIKKLIKGSSPRQDGEGTSMDMVRVAEPTPCVARPPLSPDSIGSGNMDYSMDSNSPLPSP